MRFVYLGTLLLGLVLGVVSMIRGIDRDERRRRAISFFNLPMVGSFAVGVGVTGYLFSRYSSLSAPVVALIALVIGAAAAAGVIALIAGWAVPSAARDVEDVRYALQGHVGRVTRAIAVGGEGEITFEHDGRRHVVPSRALNRSAIPAGTEIAIERIEDGIAYVELWATIEKQLKLPT
ncbi:MAG: hypothetical protein ACREON_02735 [Gemmatimonadaceae bacterium]